MLRLTPLSDPDQLAVQTLFPAGETGPPPWY